MLHSRDGRYDEQFGGRYDEQCGGRSDERPDGPAGRAALRLSVAVAVVVAVVSGGGGGPGGDRAGAAVRVADVVWDELADCESGGDWRADTGNGYYGGLQIWPPTWADAGGLRYADRPDHASRREQTTVAEEILRREGWEAWSGCARELGLLGGPKGTGTSFGGWSAARGEGGAGGWWGDPG